MRIAAWVLLAYLPIATSGLADDACIENPRCDFHFPASSTVRLEPSSLRGLSEETLWEARNEILARHGYAFDTQRAIGYFSAKRYWSPTTKNVRLSAVEKDNIDLIKAFEIAAKGPVGQTLVGREVVTVGLDATGDGFLALRTGPSTSFPQVGRLLQGDRATVKAIKGAWLRVKYWGGEGWAYSKWLAPASSLSVTTDLTVKIISENRAPSDDEVASLKQQVEAMSQQIQELTGAVQLDGSNVGIPSAARIDAKGASERLAQLQVRRQDANALLGRYATPIHPENGNTKPDARQSSEAFQKVPYFIPGTITVGEVWVEPLVTDEGELRFVWNFVDPQAEYKKVALTVSMESSELEKASAAFGQIIGWSETARKNGIKKTFEKEAFCFPAAVCNETNPSRPRTSIVFRIGDDGSTSSVVKRSQGSFDRFYGFSIESTLLMQAYFARVLEQSSQEFRASTATKEELDDLFK